MTSAPTATKRRSVFAWNSVIDPGIGFVESGALNLIVLRRLGELKSNCGGLPVLVGASHKGFIGQICGRPEPKDHAWATAAACCAAIQQGADLLRIHDAAEMVDVAKISDAIWRQHHSCPCGAGAAYEHLESVIHEHDE